MQVCRVHYFTSCNCTIIRRHKTKSSTCISPQGHFQRVHGTLKGCRMPPRPPCLHPRQNAKFLARPCIITSHFPAKSLSITLVRKHVIPLIRVLIEQIPIIIHATALRQTRIPSHICDVYTRHASHAHL
jgi:hypothetical protein